MALTEETNMICREMLLEMRRDLLNEIKDQRQSNSERDYLGDICDCAASIMEAEYVYMLGDRLRQRLYLIGRLSTPLKMVITVSAQSVGNRLAKKDCC